MDAAQQIFFQDHYPRRLTMPDYATTGFNPGSATMSDGVHFYTEPYVANMNGNHNATRTLPTLATSSSSLRNGLSHAGTEQTTARDEEVQRFEHILFKLLEDPQVGSVVLTEEFRADNPNDFNRIIFTVSGRKQDCNVDGAAATMANV
ncbi:hypothetical protein LTR49_026527 [Elasticomyces elasticus]|nr:hypothetical protein LTR49_026527 [Elasticomyces elasticus]